MMIRPAPIDSEGSLACPQCAGKGTVWRTQGPVWSTDAPECVACLVCGGSGRVWPATASTPPPIGPAEVPGVWSEEEEAP